jgi:DNA (cytosine-5)-methyltransferase 1
MEKNIVAVDLFCGAGGLTRGLKEAGIDVLRGFDIDKKAKETYEKNNPGSEYFCVDVSKLEKEDLISGIDRKQNLFLLAGCAPCQPFSLINNKSIENDDRKILLLEFGRLIKETKPDFVMMENVPGLKNNKGKLVFEKFISILEKEGYNYDVKVLDVKDYGVPQKRTRLVLIASKKYKVKIPEPTHGIEENKKNFVTVKDAISKFPKILPGKKHDEIPNHACRDLSELNKRRMKFIKKNGGSRKDLPEELVLECHKNHIGHGDVYGRMKWDDVSPTLTCKCTSISNGRFAHPTQNRGISVREAASIQTFPEDYIFYGNLTESTKWVGNAVPVKFSEVFGQYFKSLISC